MSRTITSSPDRQIKTPTGSLISGELTFTAERSRPDTPLASKGRITITAGAYSGDIEDGTYTVHLHVDGRAVKLGHGVTVAPGDPVDVLTLIEGIPA